MSTKPIKQFATLTDEAGVEALSVATGGNMTATGFTSLGTGNAGLKCKVLTGTTAATENNSAAVAHGLTSSKIRSVSAVVFYSADSAISPGYTYSAGYQYDVSTSSTSVIILNHPTNSENILSKTFYVTVWYIE